MYFWVSLAFAIVVGGLLVDRVRRERRRRAALQKTLWGVPRVAEADPYADEYWRFASAGRAGTTDEIDDRTWGDLDLNDVLRCVDRTRSTLGRQQLYARLRWGTGAPNRERLEQMVVSFGQATSARPAVETAYDHFDPHIGQQFWRITRDRAIDRKAWYALFPVLTAATMTSAALMFFFPSFFLVFAIVVLINMFVRAATETDMMAYRSAFAQVAPILAVARRLNGIPAIADESVSAHLMELRSLGRAASWMSRDPLEVGELAALLYEYLNLLFVIDANALLVASTTLQRSRHAVVDVSAWVGDVDLAMSVASLRAEPRQWCVPNFVADSEPLVLTDAWHPMLPDPVTNSISLKTGEGLIVTGSNMSGKSTFLRTVGVCAVLANGVNSCPASAHRAPPVRTRACIGRSDSLAEGKSYYLTEADRVLEILRAAESPGCHLFLFDELFRGTNTVERVAAGEAVLRELARPSERRAPHVIVATHDNELVALVSDLYRPVHFEEQVAAGGLTFDYQLRPGPATTRNAITLLELRGAPARVVNAARSRADALTALQSI